MLVNMIDMLKKARTGKYGIAAPNICNEITARAAILAAEENDAPIIIDLVFKANPDIPLLTKMVVEMAEKATVPVALNLDYCISYEETMQALKLGFTSVSLDRTDKPIDQNIKETIEIVEVAHALNASVEGQLGRVVSAKGNNYLDRGLLTEPDLVKEYIEKTNIDALAISIGNARGKYDSEVRIDFDRLERINKESSVPLCIHGGSYTGIDNLKKMIYNGVTKINLSTELYSSGNDAVLNGNNCFQKPYELFDVYSNGYKDKLVEYMSAFGQIGKAKETIK
ncbi:MAG: class II fructose-bisphosphate aldolase [Erysipelotrichaceae bacterium]